MTEHDSIIAFLQEMDKSISMRHIEIKAQIPEKTLSKAKKKERNIPQKHFPKLIAELKKHGYHSVETY